MNLKEKLAQQKAEAEAQGYAPKGGNDWFKWKEGNANRFRILTEFETIYESYQDGICFTGCGFEGSPKYMCYVLDIENLNIDNEREPEIKLAKLPGAIANYVAGLQEDEEYAFDGMPMPYDIKVTVENAGTKEVKYTPMPAKESQLPASVMEAVSKLTPIPEIIAKMKEKNAKKHGKPYQRPDGTTVTSNQEPGYEYPDMPVDENGIPF